MNFVRRGLLMILGVVCLLATPLVLTQPISANQTDSVAITKVLFGPADQEFVELYNPGTTAVDLTGWQLEFLTKQFPDAAGQPTRLLQRFEGVELAPGAFWLVRHPQLWFAGSATAPSRTVEPSCVRNTSLSPCQPVPTTREPVASSNSRPWTNAFVGKGSVCSTTTVFWAGTTTVVLLGCWEVLELAPHPLRLRALPTPRASARTKKDMSLFLLY